MTVSMTNVRRRSGIAVFLLGVLALGLLVVGGRERSSSVTRLPIQRSARVINQSERMPTGPRAVNTLGTVKTPASRRAIEKASP